MRRCLSFICVTIAVLVFSGPLQGGTLVDDTNVYLQGMENFANAYVGFSVEINADVEYAVYTGIGFQSTFGSMAEVEDDDWVYAYQIFSNASTSSASNINAFSVGLDGDELPIFIGYTDDLDPSTTTVSPSALYFAQSPPDPPQSARWDFIDYVEETGSILSVGGISDILFFTSPFSPHTDSSSVINGFTVTEELPSPTPEPATFYLLLTAAVFMLGMRQKSR